MHQSARLNEAHAAGHRRCDGGRDRAIHAVHINGEIVPATIWNETQDGIYSDLMQLVRRDQMGTPGPGRVHLLLARAAPGAEADLEDLADVLHFRGATHRAREAVFDAINLVAPVEMLIDLDERDWPAYLEGAQHGDRYRMVAAEHDRHRAGADNFAHQLLGARHVRLEIMDEIGRASCRDSVGGTQ